MTTTTRKTAAQKAAEAAERAEYTTPIEPDTETPAAEGQARPAKKGETVQQLKNRLRNEAEREVLNAHKGEVIKITEAKYDEHSLEYVRRLTEAEKAAKTIEELYGKFPHLRPKVEEPAQEAPAAAEPVVQAVPGGALEAFRNTEQDPSVPGVPVQVSGSPIPDVPRDPYFHGEAEEPDNYRDVEAREGE